ncbi:pyruvate dehydrogenase complex E1 component subunit beta [Hyphomicrobium sp.]|uniref:pyruvate dehydrogenase complex E1 component subunit beta n=1 Tax=Hyphomicrobium sp. TaxID=82 RepID=UPI002E306830|nr:pyruvate dehydrogenase complex E1 component subunit beta [Hyphomicrobium sp.]HEX2842991.1 pyruvate dehydrogenase complex E1 component subunit beta [Hyphomicrobium sp.]
MRREILMPSVTPSMKDGKISRWHVAEGQAVSAGDLLVEVATSSATLEIEAENEGRVERILVPAGTEGVKVNTPIAVLFGSATASGPRAPAVTAPLAFASLEPLPRTKPVSPDRPVPVAALLGAGPTFREALRDALAAEMRRDPEVFLIGADVAQNRGAMRVTQGLLDEFGPERVVSAPTVDEAVLGLAVGAAFAGLKPVVELSSWGRSMDVIGPYLVSASETFYLSGGRLPVPIVFRGANGFVPGMTGQDARCVAAQLVQIPGLKVVQPASAAAASVLLQAAIRDPGPVAVLEDAQLYGMRDTAAFGDVAWIGAARIARSGTDVTIVAAGHAVLVALEAAAVLARAGVEAEVVDLMSLRPLDREAVVSSVARTGRLLTVEEGWGEGGIGAEIIACVTSSCFRDLKSPPLRLSGASLPMPYAAELQASARPGPDQVVGAVLALVRGA